MIQRIWATFQTWFLLAILFLFLLPFWTYAQILTSNHGASSLGSTAIAAKTEQRNNISNVLPVRMPDGRLLASEIARIVMRHELIVAVTSFDTPPFVQELNGTLTGPDIDLVKQVAAVLKVPVRFDRSSQNHNDVVEMVAMGRADLGVSKLARTLIRSQYVLFSEPYMRLEHSLLINRLAFANIARDQSISQAVRNFNGTIGVLAGSAWEEFARQNFPKATVVPFPSFEKSVEAVKKGEVVAVYRDAIEVRSVMLSDPSLALTLRTVSFSDLESVLSVMVGQRDIVLLSLVNQVIANQTEKLTVNSLLKKMK
jgi:polar amino acid transport system substrate-binding protein